MEVEAALQPPGVRLNTSLQKYVSRALRLAPSYLISQEFASLLVTPSPKPIVQLERIKSSIQDLVDQLDLEPLQYFKYPPWNRVTPYTVNISPLSKEEATQAYNSNLYLNKDEFTIYTDASFIPGENSLGISVSLVVLNYG